MVGKKIRVGEVIETLDGLYTQKAVFWGESRIVRAIFANWSMKYAKGQLADGKIRYVVMI